MKHSWLFAAVLSVVVVTISVGIWLGFGSSYAASQSDRTQASTRATQTGQPNNGQGMNHQSSGNSNDESLARQQQQQEAISQLIQQFQRHAGNINQFMRQLYVYCQGDACQQMINQALADYPDQQFAKTLAQLLERLPAYEKAMQSQVMSTSMTPRQRYEKIWNLREQTLGQKEAQLAFGEEKEFASYQFAYGDLLARAPQMTTQQRLAELDQLQRQYKTTSSTVDGADGNYDKALKLALIGVTDPAQQQEIIQQQRLRYFSPQEAAQLAKREQQVEQQQQQVSSYQTDLAKLQQEMNQRRQALSESAWQQQYELRLEQLRQQHFK